MNDINKNINLKLMSNIDIRNRLIVSAININELNSLLLYSTDIRTKLLLEKLICEYKRLLNNNKHLSLEIDDLQDRYIRIIRKQKPMLIVSTCYTLENGTPWLFEDNKLILFEKKKISKNHED